MRLEYNIATFPADTGGYNLTAYTEGVLRVRVEAAVFLDVSGILLVELAIVLNKWIRACASTPTDFYYASMDFEEEPILAFRYDASADKFSLESVWSRVEVEPVPREHVVAAAQHYVSQLRDELHSKYGVDLDEKLHESITDG